MIVEECWEEFRQKCSDRPYSQLKNLLPFHRMSEGDKLALIEFLENYKERINDGED